MRGRFSQFFREGVWVVLGQILAILGSLVSVRVLTELLDPHDYGELSLGMTVAGLVNQVILGPLGVGITRFYAPAFEQNKLPFYFRATIGLSQWAVVIIIGFMIIAVSMMMILRNTKWIALTVLALFFSIFVGINGNLSGILSAARNRRAVAFYQGIDPWFKLCAAAVLLVWLQSTSEAAVLGYMIATLVITVFQLFSLIKLMSVDFSVLAVSGDYLDWQRKIFAFSWPISTFGIFTWLLISSDRWALQTFSSTQEVGVYAVLYQLGYYPIALVTGMMMQLIMPILYQRAGDATDQERNAHVNRFCSQLSFLGLGLTFFVFVIIWQLHEILFEWLVAQEYRSQSYLLPWFVISGGLFAVGQMLATNLQTRMQTREMIPAKIITALMGVVFNILGARYFGINGVIGAGVLFSIFYCFWMACLVYRENRRYFFSAC